MGYSYRGFTHTGGGNVACSMILARCVSNLVPSGGCGKIGHGMCSPPGADSMLVMRVIAAEATTCLVVTTMVLALIN